MGSCRTASNWMRAIVAAAAAHGFWQAAMETGSLEERSLRAAISAALLAAALDPVKHWPAVLAGLISRIVPHVAGAITSAARPLSSIFSDAIWWAPLSFILAAAYFRRLETFRVRIPEVISLGLQFRTDRGCTLDSLSRQGPVLLVFLRHPGCPFCREALSDLAAQRQQIEAAGATIVLAHMTQPGTARAFFRKYGLDDVHQISDPARGLYRAWGLCRGGIRKVFGPRAWFRGVSAAIVKGHGVGLLRGDIFQMPGVFMLFHGQILRAYRHQSVADRPNYVRFLTEDVFSRMVS